METENSASLTLTGLDLDPEQITRRTSISPSKTWRLGEKVDDRSVLRYQHNGWRLTSGLPKQRDLEEHVESVLTQIRSSWSVLTQLGATYDAEMACVVYSYGGDRPPIHLSKGVLRRVSELNADIDIDLYVLPAR